MERLVGLENEYAFHATGPRGGAVNWLPILAELLEIARAQYPCLPSLNGNGVFLGNGSRLYLDTGAHVEYCTAESSNPWDVVRYLLAGEQMLTDLASTLVRRGNCQSVTFYKSNVDYSGTASTWGAHESYGHRIDPQHLPENLIPFLVSRAIITGAGGFDPTTPYACRFTLSPRAYHITANISNNSTGGRGIHHTKDEPLCAGGYHRLHVLVGESLCSHTGNWLKFALTGLVVAMADAGLCPGKDVALRLPVDALRAYAADPTCKATAATVAGGQVSALQIQQHYLEIARRNAAAPFMPSWTGRAIQAWEAILARLADAPDSVATSLDWGIKRRIYGMRIQKRGFTWNSLQQWSIVMELLHHCARASSVKLPKGGLSADYILDPQSPLKGIASELTSHLASCGLSWDQCDRYLKLRLELFEIDTRFGQLGADGIFNALDSAGVLQHQFPGVDNISHAIEFPPDVGRAKLRGEVIKRLHGNGRPYGCDWDTIVDVRNKVALDLRDPWTSSEHWSDHVRDLRECQRFMMMMEQLTSDAVAVSPHSDAPF